MVSLLTNNAESQRLVRVSRETLEEALESLNIDPEVLAMWDILLDTEQEAKRLAEVS